MDYTLRETMPKEALVVAIPVLMVSIISLALSLLWFLMQHYHGEKWSCMSCLSHGLRPAVELHSH